MSPVSFVERPTIWHRQGEEGRILHVPQGEHGRHSHCFVDSNTLHCYCVLVCGSDISSICKINYIITG